MTTRMTLAATRAKSIQYVIDTEFGGDTRRFSETVEIKLNTVYKYLKPNSERPCNDKAARAIERKLDKPHCYLDYLQGEQRETYYITIGTDARHTYEIVSMLQREESIQECAVVFGDFDLLLKVEVNSNQFLDLLMSKIVRLPGVTSSNTYLVASSLHWQRQQIERMELPERSEVAYYTNGVDGFIHKKILQLFDEITELEKGEITAKDGDTIAFKPHEVIDGVQHSIHSTKDPFRKINSFNKFIKKEKELIQSGVESKRLLLIEENYKKHWNRVEDDYKKFTGIGCQVRFLFFKDWSQTPLSAKPEEMAILDDLYVVVRREDQHRYLIKKTDSIVNAYISVFDSNWEKSYSYNEVYEMLMNPDDIQG